MEKRKRETSVEFFSKLLKEERLTPENYFAILNSMDTLKKQHEHIENILKASGIGKNVENGFRSTESYFSTWTPTDNGKKSSNVKVNENLVQFAEKIAKRTGKTVEEILSSLQKRDIVLIKSIQNGNAKTAGAVK